jgi:hypothetical protein
MTGSHGAAWSRNGVRPIFLGQAAAGPAHYRMSAARTRDNAFSLSEDYLIKYSVKTLISEMNGRFGCASSRHRRTAVGPGYCLIGNPKPGLREPDYPFCSQPLSPP